MIGLDANVLLRYVLQDDERQSLAANEIFDSLTEDNPGYLSLVTLLESIWVLSRLRKLDRASVAAFVAQLLDSQLLVVQNAHAVRQALGDYSMVSVGFADALVARLGSEAGCLHTLTFDRAAAQLVGMHFVDA